MRRDADGAVHVRNLREDLPVTGRLVGRQGKCHAKICFLVDAGNSRLGELDYSPGEVAAEVSKLKQQEGRDLLIWGHGLLAETLLKQHLIDVLDLSIYPVVAGRGRPFFRDDQKANLRFVTTKTFSKGIVKLTYEPLY
jgi:riboflavin biosynthesis pyrimidine reductase